MLFNDPPKHTRLRRLVNGAFKPPVIDALRERIAAVTDRAAAIALPSGTTAPVRPDGRPRAAAAGARDLRRPRPAAGGLRADQGRGPTRWPCIVEPVMRRSSASRCAAARPRRWPPTCAATSRVTAPRRPRDDLLGPADRARRTTAALERRRTAGQPDPAVRRRPRDDDQPDRQRHADACCATPPSWRGCARSRRWSHCAVDEMLRFEGSVNMVARHTDRALCGGRARSIPAGETIFFMLGAGQPRPGGVRRARPLRHRPHARTRTWASAPASTTASARRWRGWRRDRVPAPAGALPGAGAGRRIAALAAVDQPARPGGADAGGALSAASQS